MCGLAAGREKEYSSSRVTRRIGVYTVLNCTRASREKGILGEVLFLLDVKSAGVIQR